MQQRIVLGMGSGRCGTLTLAQVLSRQPGVAVSHEDPPLLPWQPRPGRWAVCSLFCAANGTLVPAAAGRS